MESTYSHLKEDFKQELSVFRLKWLMFNLTKGGIILFLSFFFILLFYHFLAISFLLSIWFKTIFYYFFLFTIFSEFSLFILKPFFSFFLSYRLENDFLLKQILKFYSEKSDVLISVYNLAFHQESITGDFQLKQAAFIQKYNYLKYNNLSVCFPKKTFLQQLIILFFPLVLIFSFHSGLEKWYIDLKNYEHVYSPAHNIIFEIQNESLNVEYGKSFQLRLKTHSDDFLIENVFICYGGGEFLMSREDSVFVYDFGVINNNIKFNFKVLDKESDLYTIKVLPSPAINNYQVTLSYPQYTGLKSEILTNTVDFRALYGSSLKFNLNFTDVDSLYLLKGDQLSVVPLKSKNSTDFSMIIHDSGEYALIASNSHFRHKNLLNFTITCIPDLYPGIQLTEIQDSTRSSIYYFYGAVVDDYGFSALYFNYSINGEGNTVMPVNITKNVITQEFYFAFDFAEFAGMDKSKINYFFEVFDNDNISGPKSTRSDSKIYQIPDLNTIFDYNLDVSNTVNSSLKEAEKMAGDIVSGVKELQKKMLDNNIDNWEKQQLSKDIVEKKNKLDKLLQSVKENNLKKSDLNKNFSGQDSLLLDKQKQIQELLDKIMDDDMKKLMEEFSKLSDDFSKEKFQNLDEKMKLSFDQMTQELDRNIELLKRFQIEERHDLISKQLDKLKDKQDQLIESMKDKSVSKDSLSEMSKEIKEQIKNVQNNYENLLKENKDLSEPYSLDHFESDFDKLSQKSEQQQQDVSENKKDKKSSEQLKKEMDELSEKMEQQQQQNFINKSLPENDIELIIQNILIISLTQEELMKQFPQVQPQGLRYIELGRLQDLKKQEYKIVKDSLSVLAKSNLMLASLLSHKFYDIEIKFGLLADYIQNNKRSELLREQQYIINYLNDIALSLADALQNGKKNSDDGKEGSGERKGSGKSSGKGSPGDKEGSYGDMKKFQNSLKKQLEGLVSQMKKGEKGKPLQQGISNMIRENELFRKSLNDYISESGSLSNAEKQLLNEIGQMLEDNIRDLSNYSVSGQLTNRNNLIYNKLLMSEKASKERQEFEEKRKAQSATEMRYEKPDALLEFKKKSGLIKTDFQKSDLKLNDYFKNIYNNYYIKLGNE